MATEINPAPFSTRIRQRFDEDIATHGQPSNALISAVIAAMEALEAKQTAMFESQGSMLGALETVTQSLSTVNGVSKTHNDALKSLLEEVKELRAGEASAPPATQD